MGTKSNPGPFDALANVHPDEPIFVLRAQDVTADGLVEQWANRAAKRGVSPEKVAEARRLAQAMRDWPTRRLPT